MRQSLVKGPIQMLFSAFCFAVMAYFAKLASATIPGSEVVFFRFLLGVIVAIILAAFGRVDLKATRRDLLIARGVFGGSAIILYFMAIAGGSLTNSTVLNNTYPIFATLIAVLALKEKVPSSTWFSLIIAWVGVGFLIHPDFQQLFWPDLLGLASGVISGFAIVIVRELRKNGEPAWTVFFYLSLFGLVASFFFAIPEWVWPNPLAWWYLFATAVLGLVAQVTMTSAYKYCSASSGSILSMTTMVFAAFFGMVGLGETLTGPEALGALLIGVGGGLVAWLGNQDRDQKIKDK